MCGRRDHVPDNVVDHRGHLDRTGIGRAVDQFVRPPADPAISRDSGRAEGVGLPRGRPRSKAPCSSGRSASSCSFPLPHRVRIPYSSASLQVFEHRGDLLGFPLDEDSPPGSDQINRLDAVHRRLLREGGVTTQLSKCYCPVHRDSGQATWIQPRSEFTVTVDGQQLIAVVGQVGPRRNPELLKGQKGGRIGPR